MTDTSKIAAKIKALLAKARSTEHEAEASAFMAKAQELLEQHQIDLGSLEDADDRVYVDQDGLARTQKDPTWHRKLYAALGHLYGCRVVYRGTIVRGALGSVTELTGRESAIVTTKLMYPWVKSQCEAAGKTLRKSYPEMSSSQHTRRVANALCSRIARLAAQNQAEGPKTEAAAQNALVTVDRVKQIFDEHYSEGLSKARATSVKTSAAARAAAEGIGLHRQAEGSKTLSLT